MNEKPLQPEISSEQALDFVQKFNRIVTLDEELARQLPPHEFELSFDTTGSIYVDGESLGVNVQRRYRALRLRTSPIMRPTSMKVTAWNSGKYNRSGAGYGLRLDPADRNAVFNRSWSDVVLDLPNGTAGVRIKLSPAFWRDCPEFRSAEIGKWLIGAGYGRWRRGSPPTFTLVQVSGNHFSVT